MATDFFLKLDGIKGESTDAAHSGSIDVESFSWSQENSTIIGSASGAGSGKAKFEEAHFTTRVSAATPLLALACSSGQHIREAVLTARKAGGKQEEYYKVTFKTVFLTRIRHIGAPGGDVIPREEVTFVFGSYSMDYRPQKADGTLGTSVMSGWDQIKNTKA